MSGHKRIIETAAVLLATVLVFSRGYAEQRFQKQMELLEKLLLIDSGGTLFILLD